MCYEVVDMWLLVICTLYFVGLDSVFEYFVVCRGLVFLVFMGIV